MTAPVSLYAHLPFCLSKCAYCDFRSHVPEHAREQRDYVDALLEDARRWAARGLLADVPTLYVGGGTPTTLGDDLVRLVEGLRAVARLREDAEVTVETNPDVTTPALVHRLVEAGVNRFSMGVQSFDDGVLRTLGRRHDAGRAEQAAAVLRESGARFSLDLICGVPGQSEASWRDTVERAVATGAGHVSVYPLSVEEGTPLAASIASGALPPPGEDAAADMMLLAERVLEGAGLERYEVASYAREGERCRHNVVYWTGGAYLGLGDGASSMLPAALVAELGARRLPVPHPGAARGRFVADEPESVEFLTSAEAAREDVMLGLRLVEGVTAEQARAAGVEGALRQLADDALVERANGRWRTTRRGWLLGNEVFGRVWAAQV